MKEATTSDGYSKSEGRTIRLPLPWIELVTSIVLLAIISGYLVEAFAMPSPYNEKSVGAGAFPIIIGVATLIPLVSLLITSLVKILRNIPSEDVSISRPLGVLLAMVILILQALLLDTVGLIISIALFSALLMLAAGERRPVFIISIPIAFALGMYVVFVGVLGVYFS